MLLLCMALPTQYLYDYEIRTEIINTVVHSAEEHNNVSSALCDIKLLHSIGEVEQHKRHLESDKANKGICVTAACIWK